jgi:uncharacterized damage-inducible protein DinB
MSLAKFIIEYVIWANDIVWKIVDDLTDERFRQVLGEGAGSIQSRYVHLAEDAWEWYHDWHDEEPEEPDFLGMTREELYFFLTDYMMKWKRLINERTVDTFREERDGKIVSIGFDEMLFHLVNHHAYHRGQIVMGLRLLGKTVQITDYVPCKLETA